MKITTFLLITFIMQVSANSNAQNISIKKNNSSLEQVLNEIRSQSGYDFFYNKNLLKSANLVSIEVSDASIDKVLAICFRNQPLEYMIQDKTVVIKEKNKIFENVISGFKLINVKGRIMSKENKGLEGASINVKGKNKGAIADVNGNFILLNVEEGAILQISYVGFKTIDVLAKAELGMIFLEPGNSPLDEVQVIAYGTVSRRLNTGNVSTVTAEEISKQPVTNILQALQNLVPGLTVVQSNGFASAPFKVEIRGRNNLPVTANPNNVSDPLYVIDGVPITTGSGDALNRGINQNGLTGPAGGQSPFFSINPADIESVSVLKDADATAIYGARAANGVILINTKRGTPGKTVFNINTYTGITFRAKKLNLMNTEAYLAMRKEALANDKITPTDGNAYDLTIYDQNKYTDWQDYLLKDATTTDAQMSLSGGSEKTSFRLNGSYHNETPPYPGDFDERRMTAAFNLNHRALNNRLNVASSINFGYTISNLPSYDPYRLIFLAPNAPDVYNVNGNLNYAAWKPGSYPFVDLVRPYKATNDNLIMNTTVGYNILKGLSFNVNLGYNMYNQNQLVKEPGSTRDPAGSQTGQSRFGTNRGSTFTIDPNLSYSLYKGRGHIQVMLGGNYQSTEVNGSYINGNGYLIEALLEDLSAATTIVGTTNNSQTKFQSAYARLTYDYANKYIVNLNARRDGSSRFGPNKQFGNFGSIGAAWIFSEEKFLKDNLSFLSFGKLRGSYGTTGGDGLGDYQYLESLRAALAKYQGASALSLVRAANADFSWAETRKLEVAVELGFLNDRVLFTSAWFRNRTGNQLVANPLPDITGFSSVVTNLPALVENSGWEFTLQTKNFSTEQFRWNSTLNFGFVRNKLLEFPNLEKSAYNRYYKVGESISRIGLYHYQGMDPQTGMYNFEDINKNNSIYFPEDYYYYNTMPDFNGSLNNAIYYNQLSLSFLFSFVKQKGFENTSNDIPGAIGANQLVNVQDRWQNPGDITERAMYTTKNNTSISNYLKSDALWKDASYVRLQNISLSYNISVKSKAKNQLCSLRIYTQAQNIFTITNYKGVDPASPGLGIASPPRKTIVFGAQVTF